MKVLINYADKAYRRYQQYNSKTGMQRGGFDKVIEYTPDDIDANFAAKNEKILSTKRGAGLWLWKPYVITKALAELNEGDYLFYCDSGSYFIHSIDNLIAVLEKDGGEIMTFETPLLNIQFAGASFVSAVTCDNIEEWLYANQVLGGFILIKNSTSSRRIMREFLELCQHEELMFSNEMENNHPVFIAHREDQTVLSYLMWKHGIKSYRDPSQYGEMPFDYIKYGVDNAGLCYGCFKKHEDSPFPTIIRLYRKKKAYNFLPRLRFVASWNIKNYFVKRAIQF